MSLFSSFISGLPRGPSQAWWRKKANSVGGFKVTSAVLNPEEEVKTAYARYDHPVQLQDSLSQDDVNERSLEEGSESNMDQNSAKVTPGAQKPYELSKPITEPLYAADLDDEEEAEEPAPCMKEWWMVQLCLQDPANEGASSCGQQLAEFQACASARLGWKGGSADHITMQ